MLHGVLVCFHLIWVLRVCVRRGERGSSKGLVHGLLVQLFTLGTTKIEVFETFCGTVTTRNDHPRYLKHVLGSICVFFSLFGYWACAGGVGGCTPTGLVHNLLVQLCTLTLGISNIKVSGNFFIC